MDLETIPSGNIDDIEVKVPGNYKNQESIDKYIAENREKQFRQRSLNPSRADIAAIAFAVDDSDVMSLWTEPDNESLSERVALTRFWDEINKDIFEETLTGTIQNDVYWVGFNIRQFDLNILFKKAIKYQLYDLAKIIPRHRYDSKVVDIMEIWTGGALGFDGGNTMKEVMEYLGMSGKRTGMDGSMVYDYYMEGRYQEIAEYCASDVEEERELFYVIEQGI